MILDISVQNHCDLWRREYDKNRIFVPERLRAYRISLRLADMTRFSLKYVYERLREARILSG